MFEPDIYAMPARDLSGPIAGHVVLLSAANDTLSRVEAFTSEGGAVVNAQSLELFTQLLSTFDGDGLVWRVVNSWQVADVVGVVDEIRASLRSMARTASSRPTH
jgi:hypothetical protein